MNLIWKTNAVYVDRKGFEYLCVDIGTCTVTFEARRADGSITLGARYYDGRYRRDIEHDYDVIARKTLA